ncbi:hypothetical protein DRW07_16515 [Alteromonas sediminis]|uniref:DUF4064 domain-containing protein n=1 Tax=Alteromonas sediminis TaxID=2259342 RepID=A0A3N5XVZ6_9ALTE|nr:hypothetical protein [Alteromonas sediminis]RPJ64927.1 hypothetical protein DRW07_16515 [Alteromonas sediminis]
MKKEAIGKYVAITAVLLFLVLPVGLASTMFSMYSDFQAISLFETSEAPANANERSIGRTLTILGMGLTVPSIALLIVSVTALQYRPRWIFWFSVVVSSFVIFLFPIGTVLSVTLLVALFIIMNKPGSGKTTT